MDTSLQVFLNCVDIFFTYFTVYDIVRNQYFYLGGMWPITYGP